MNDSAFLNRLWGIKDSGRLADLKRIFSNGPGATEGLRILAQLGVPISEEEKSFPYLFAGYLHGVGVQHKANEPFPRVLREVAIDKEPSKNPHEDTYPLDRRFDTLVASATYDRLRSHLVKLVPYVSEREIDYEPLLRNLRNWSRKTRDKWIEVYYQTERRKK